MRGNWTPMKLWLISQDVNSGYDTYDSAVVSAETEDDARKAPPTDSKWFRADTEWADPKDVNVRYLGETTEPAGAICASYKAG